MNNTGLYTKIIKRIAAELGFHSCGIAKAQKLDEDAKRLADYLNAGYHGEMNYMENHFEMRTDPRILVPGCKSVISLMYNYFPEQKQEEGIPKISKYAYGTDYHNVIRKKLKQFFYRIENEIGKVEGRAFVDSAPVLEKSWAARSGLGWIGKHSCLIAKQQGSFFFIAELIVDLELEYDTPINNYCGSCTRCIDACPTAAILPDKILDASKCISYLTIELRDKIPNELSGNSEGWIFGCDICQDVCPWNRFSKPHHESSFLINDLLINRNVKGWEDITEEVFRELYIHSPIKRSKWEGMKRNLAFIKTKKPG